MLIAYRFPGFVTNWKQAYGNSELKKTENYFGGIEI